MRLSRSAVIGQRANQRINGGRERSQKIRSGIESTRRIVNSNQIVKAGQRKRVRACLRRQITCDIASTFEVFGHETITQVHPRAQLDDAAAMSRSIAITIRAIISNGDIYQSCGRQLVIQTAAPTLGGVSANSAVGYG